MSRPSKDWQTRYLWNNNSPIHQNTDHIHQNRDNCTAAADYFVCFANGGREGESSVWALNSSISNLQPEIFFFACWSIFETLREDIKSSLESSHYLKIKVRHCCDISNLFLFWHLRIWIWNCFEGLENKLWQQRSPVVIQFTLDKKIISMSKHLKNLDFSSWVRAEIEWRI